MSSQQEIDALKAAAAKAAVAQIMDGMVVGLGSGTTAEITVAAIGQRVREGLKLIGVSTSEKTSALAKSLGIPMRTLEENPQVDLTIDGADEIEIGTLNLVKGGGGNLLREKIVALASTRMLVVADERKLVAQLGVKASVPVDVVPFGWKTTAGRLEALGCRPVLRHTSAGEIFVTDGGAYILDCAFGGIASPVELGHQLDNLVGVVEHGLFLGMASEVVLGGVDGVRSLRADSFDQKARVDIE